LGIKSLELRAYVHATEERERVIQALKSILGEDLWEQAEVTEERYEGHYGNPVTVLTVKINDADKASKAFESILSRLTHGDVSILLHSLDERVDKNGTLYFRLSKQDAYLGRLIVYEADDVVRVSISFQGRRRKALEEYRKKLEEAGE